MEKALTPSPSPIRWERGAVSPGEGQVHEKLQPDFATRIAAGGRGEPRRKGLAGAVSKCTRRAARVDFALYNAKGIC